MEHSCAKYGYCVIATVLLKYNLLVFNLNTLMRDIMGQKEFQRQIHFQKLLKQTNVLLVTNSFSSMLFLN